eukprot:NP_494630.1 Uncharacterized protein CELE_C46E10.2 [Caenorhabditis elegans]
MCSDSNCYVPFFNIYWSFYAIFGFTFQLTLIFLIFQKLPVFLSNFKYFLVNNAFSQLALVVFAFTHSAVVQGSGMAILVTIVFRFIHLIGNRISKKQSTLLIILSYIFPVYNLVRFLFKASYF